MKKIVSIAIVLIVVAGIIVAGYFILGPLLTPLHKKVKNTILIDSDEDFISLGFPGTGTPEDPFIIENQVLGINESLIKEWYIGLEVINTSSYFVVRDCTFFGGMRSISLKNIKEGTARIVNNKFFALPQAEWDWFRGYSGIEIFSSNNVNVSSNTFGPAKRHESGLIKIFNSSQSVFENNTFLEHSILIENSMNTTFKRNSIEIDEFWIENSLNTSLIENIFFSYSDLIYISSSSIILIENNTIGSIECDLGIGIAHSNNITIKGNSIYRSTTDTAESGTGIGLYNCSFSSISYNTVVNYYSYAIKLLEYTHNVSIFSNNFFNNTGYEYDDPYSQGFDRGFDNIWYNPSLLAGNFWNDLGLNSTYEIAGSAGSFDLYPLTEPVQ